MTADAALRPRHQADQSIGDITRLDTGDAKPARGLAGFMDIGGFGKQALKQRIKAIPAVFGLLTPRT